MDKTSIVVPHFVVCPPDASCSPDYYGDTFFQSAGTKYVTFLSSFNEKYSWQLFQALTRTLFKLSLAVFPLLAQFLLWSVQLPYLSIFPSNSIFIVSDRDNGPTSCECSKLYLSGQTITFSVAVGRCTPRSGLCYYRRYSCRGMHSQGLSLFAGWTCRTSHIGTYGYIQKSAHLSQYTRWYVGLFRNSKFYRTNNKQGIRSLPLRCYTSFHLDSSGVPSRTCWWKSNHCMISWYHSTSWVYLGKNYSFLSSGILLKLCRRIIPSPRPTQKHCFG